MQCQLTHEQFIGGNKDCKTCVLYDICLTAADKKYLQEERDGIEEG